jgi:GNAT superfamily N-acetyltransferase
MEARTGCSEARQSEFLLSVKRPGNDETCRREIRVFSMNASIREAVADAYIKVFQGAPWYEEQKCNGCGEKYGGPEDTGYLSGKETRCRRCDGELVLGDYWTREIVFDIMNNAIRTDGFIGLCATYGVDKERVVGFSWGFGVPRLDEPTVAFSKVSDMLDNLGIDCKTTFYSAEVGVEPELQREGVGTQLMRTCLAVAKQAGYTGLCFRTVNANVVKVFRRECGEDNVKAIFNDPDPLKSERTWYYIDLTRA